MKRDFDYQALLGHTIFVVAMLVFLVTLLELATAETLHCDGFEQCDKRIDAPATVEYGSKARVRYSPDCLLIQDKTGPVYFGGDSMLPIFGETVLDLVCDTAHISAIYPSDGLRDCVAEGPINLFRDRRLETWADLLGEWGRPFQPSSWTEIGADRYVNLEFTVPADGGRSEVRWTGVQNSAQLRIGIQDCLGAPSRERAIPAFGCFADVRTAPASVIIGTSGGLSTCPVEPGRTYVLSMAWIDENDAPTCEGVRCNWLVEEI